MEAFGDTWHWDVSAETALDEVLNSGNSDADMAWSDPSAFKKAKVETTSQQGKLL